MARVSSVLERLTAAICIALMAAMTASILINVFFRYVVEAPLAWPPEAARFMMVAITLLASSLAVRYGGHVGVTVVVSLLPRRLQLLVFLAGNICVFLFLVVVLVEGWKLAFIEGPRQTAPSLQVPMTVAFVALPLGAALMMVQLVEVSVRAVGKVRDGRSPFDPPEAQPGPGAV